MLEDTKKYQKLRVIRLQEVLDLLSISRASHFSKLDNKSTSYDPTYPKPVKLGARSVGYVEHEVINWIEERMEERS